MKDYFAFQFHITDDCDQRCRHCYIFAENAQKKLVSMPFEKMPEVISRCERFCEKFSRTPYFYITGGDPVLHPDFFKLLKLLSDKGYPFTVMGNPFHLTAEVLKKLKALGCEKYQMSIDGNEKTHDWFRKKGSYRQTLEKIALINQAGIRSVIMTTVSGINIGQVEEIIDAVVKAGVNVYSFARYCPTSTDKARQSDPSFMCAEDYRALLERCDARFKAYESAGCTTYFDRKDHLWTLLAYEKGEFKIPSDAKEGMIYDGCNCGNCHLTITPKGDVLACRRVAESTVGNIFETPLETLWLGQMERYRNYEAFKKCSKCELMPYCRGCPGVASGSSGDFYAADPQCRKKIEGFDDASYLNAVNLNEKINAKVI